MRITIRASLTALIAAMLLASALSAASARNLSVSNNMFRATWSRMEFQSSLVTVRCQVTIEGSMHSRTIPKISGLLIGSVTRIDIKEASCTGGTARPDRPPPWHVTYEGFTGSLPTIATVRFLAQRFQFAIASMGVTCKYGNATDTVTNTLILNASGEATNILPLTGRNIANLLEGGGLCPAAGTMVSTTEDGRVTLLNSTTRIRVTLI